MVYLICYDIVVDKRRLKVSRLLEGYGFRVQRSVFECELSGRDMEELRERVRGIICLERDQVRFYPLFKHSWESRVILGGNLGLGVDDVAFVL